MTDCNYESARDSFSDAAGVLLHLAKTSDHVVISGKLKAQFDMLSIPAAQLAGRLALIMGRTDNIEHLLQAILVYMCSLAYTAVKLLVADVANFNEYPAPSSQNTYHGFTHDADMLDVGQPARLTPDTSPTFGVPRFDTGPTETGGLFPAKPMDAYQP
ncbi:hypothetical protein T265_02923 [Opisthorchis viverrini]|uniref:Uncharacterized protein n=1 Tax=Opisthorchis viverrini TaxID=6198 RepID=A0A074ZTE3_OPIVI|nr:hypothetical protein T265_02923 [Opisthorchis viverrini]KER30683.1 hypothetical protein T265_02923 [Opisthorchis viverrini]